MKRIALASTALTAAVVLTAATTGSQAGTTTVELEFVDHLKIEMIEQDVYVERTAGADEVYRVTAAEREQYNDAPVFATADTVHHNPLDAAFNGPYEKGRPLGFTLGEWLSASGKATYTCDDGTGSVEASFAGLVPNGVYTFWNFYLPTPAAQPFSTYDLPIGVRDGSESVFTTDARGNARYEATFTPCLQMTAAQLAAGLAIAWHSDGKTYGPTPGEFGNKTHVHLFTVLPPVEQTVVAAN